MNHRTKIMNHKAKIINYRAKIMNQINKNKLYNKQFKNKERVLKTKIRMIRV